MTRIVRLALAVLLAFATLSLFAMAGCFTSSDSPLLRGPRALPEASTPPLDGAMAPAHDAESPVEASPPVDGTMPIDAPSGPFAIGGTVTGLAGTGLVVQLDGGEVLAINANGAFVFPDAVAAGHLYTVTVAVQPTDPAQICTLSAATGTANAAVTNVVVTCATSAYSVGGTVVGLTGTGLVLALQDGSGSPLAVTSVAAAAGSFAFNTPIASGSGYKVVVQQQPSGPTQQCTVSSGGSGTLANSDAVVVVTCQTEAFTVGGTITGLTGKGLVLSDNGGDRLAIGAGATSFTFATPALSGAPFDVEVATMPSGPTQSCTVAGNMGTVGRGPVTSVTVNCGTNAFGISGTVTNLVGTGLQLSDGTDTVGVTSGTFSFPALPSGTAYTISVTGQPTSPSQACTVTAGGGGAIGSAPVTGVTVACTTTAFPLSVTVTGLSGSKTPLTVGDGVDSVDLFADGTTMLPTALASGTTYALTLAQPTMPWKTCVVTTGNASGTVGSAAISIGIRCAVDTARIVATVTGLVPPKNALQIDDGVEAIQVSANGKFTFPKALSSGDSWAITLTDPGGPAQTCVVTSRITSGTVTTGATISIGVACSWTVTVVVFGKAATCGAFTLTDGISGQTCAVAAATRNAQQTCNFGYSGTASYSVESGRVLDTQTGGLCSCFLSDANASTKLPELSFVNGKDGSSGFVFASGATTGVTTVYTYCQ